MRMLVSAALVLIILSPLVRSTLTCGVKTSCLPGEAELFHMYARNNSHAEMPSGSSYPYKVCCAGSWEMPGASCGTPLVRLNTTTNSHVVVDPDPSYPLLACLSLGKGDLDCSYENGNPGADGFAECQSAGWDTCVASLSDPAIGWGGAHVADCTAGNSYATKICCRSVDVTPPQANVTINGGDAYTATPAVTLTVGCSDAESGVEGCSYQNESEGWTAWGACPDPPAYATAWALNGTDGQRTVKVRVRDFAGNVNDTAYGTIILDAMPPSTSVDPLPQWTNMTAFNVSWQGSDSGIGIPPSGCYQVQWCDSGCDQDPSWRPIQYSPTGNTGCTLLTSAEFNQYSTTMTTGTTYMFRSRANDSLGNLEAYPVPPAHDSQTTADFDGPVILAAGAMDQSGNLLESFIPGGVTSITLFSNSTDAVSGVSRNTIDYWITTDSENYYTYDCPSGDPWGGYSSCTAPPIGFDPDMVLQYRVEVADRAGNSMLSDYFYISPHRLANFVGQAAYMEMGTEALVKVYVRNLDESRDNVTVVLSGYPLAAFEPVDDAGFSADFRSLNVTLDRKEQRAFFVKVTPTDTGTYALSLDAYSLNNPAITDSDDLQLMVGYPASFPVSDWSVLLLVGAAAAAYCLAARRGPPGRDRGSA
jgi:hypothetical protein